MNDLEKLVYMVRNFKDLVNGVLHIDGSGVLMGKVAFENVFKDTEKQYEWTDLDEYTLLTKSVNLDGVKYYSVFCEGDDGYVERG